MAESPNPWFDFNHPDFDSIDHDDYDAEQPAEPERIPSAPPLAPNDPQTSNQVSSLEPHQERAIPSEAPIASSFEDTAMGDTWDNSCGWPSSMPATDTENEYLHQYEQPSSTDNMPATDTGNEALHQYEQPYSTDVVTAEIHQINNELAEVELKLKQRRLQKRQQELLQILPTPQPLQTPERPQSQNLEPAVSPSIECRMGQDHIAPINNCVFDALQGTNPGIDSRYDVSPTDSSTFGYPNPFINLQEDSFNLVSFQQPETINQWLLNSDNAQSSNSIPTPSTGLEHNRQYGMQGPTPAFSSDYMSMRPLSMDPHYRQSLLDSASLISTMSSIQQDQHIQSPEKGLGTQKRPRTPQPNITECLSALQRQAKRSGVPQTSLDVMRFNPEPRSKRPRTSSQKQNKKDVQEAGGSCFLCLLFKKWVNL